MSSFLEKNRHDLLKRFLDVDGRGQNRLPVATNDISSAKRMINGRTDSLGNRYGGKLVVIHPPERNGTPKIYVNPDEDDYRSMVKDAYVQLGYGPIIGQMDRLTHVDHALARSIARGRYQWDLMNLVSALPNTSFGGGIEKGSQGRLLDPRMVRASIIEFLKICEISPATKNNLAEDCLIGVIQAREAGLIRSAEVPILIDAIRHSDNSVVAEAYADVKTEFDAEVKKLFKS